MIIIDVCNVFFKLFYKYRNGKYSFNEIYYDTSIKVLVNVIRNNFIQIYVNNN